MISNQEIMDRLEVIEKKVDRLLNPAMDWVVPSIQMHHDLNYINRTVTATRKKTKSGRWVTMIRKGLDDWEEKPEEDES